MAIGATVSPASINSQAGNLAGRWRQIALDTQAFAAAVAALGTAGLTGLQPNGFGAADASAMVAVAAQMATLAGAYFGTSVISPAVNFDAAFLELRGTT